ncbi:membrane protein [Thiohalobacter thiocyanaticus]|uniref:Membrane protein n=1 Tax=Thiohalobacter thiocyanaticus TaxID=585455 RepID=A0A1Z4VU26_9GAMM|nr:hypothetical protein [Thiohalobacter thiocyanaticus]BAZ94902.1 membrane protein [Thiohalobacter thiocyanaticus]
MNARLFQSLAIVSVAALLGLSLAKVSAADPWAFSVGAAVIAAIAVGIAGLFRQSTVSFEKATPPRKLLGLRIGVVGFVVALCGWLVAVFLSASVGYYIVVLGIVTGFVGFPIHIYNMFRT